MRRAISDVTVWRAWLIAVGVGLTAVGVFMGLASGTPLFEPIYRLIDPAFWRDGPPDPGTVSFRAWAMGAWGATLAGWGIAVTLMAREAFARHERWAWWTLALGSGTWFLLDTGISLVHGVAFNVAVNIIALVAVAVPLIATRSASGFRAG